MKEDFLSVDSILPTMDDWKVAARIAGATGAAASEEGLAACPMAKEACEKVALNTITEARASIARLAVGE